mmetsp:Transcript_8313/g.16915  ORF Transcript_8313/g.16915 Transcript_8313/m.16915 type:complete len:100 (-) Transcript_8313:57-356(-)
MLPEKLSTGAIKAVYLDNRSPSEVQPVLQVLELKKIGAVGPNAAPTKSDRFRLVISDGVHFHQAMLASQMNALATENRLVPLGVLRLKDFICNEVSKKK